MSRCPGRLLTGSTGGVIRSTRSVKTNLWSPFTWRGSLDQRLLPAYLDSPPADTFLFSHCHCQLLLSVTADTLSAYLWLSEESGWQRRGISVDGLLYWPQRASHVLQTSQETTPWPAGVHSKPANSQQTALLATPTVRRQSSHPLRITLHPPLSSGDRKRSNHSLCDIVTLDMKGCICHSTKWQIHHFISKRTVYVICM